MAKEPSFDITFHFPVRDNAFTIRLKGVAQLHHSTPYYVISGIRLEGHTDAEEEVLPEVHIRKLTNRNETVWVHIESDKETELSRVIGKAIEAHRQ